MQQADLDKWNRIYQSGGHGNVKPAAVLTENLHLLPEQGRALDAACGLGANALLLAAHGMETSAWDISTEALQSLKIIATERNIDLYVEQRDIVTAPPEHDSFDVIIISHFLDRTIIQDLILALRKNGLIFYQTFIIDKIDDSGPGNPDYRLFANELLTMFDKLHIVVYREEGSLGDIKKGFRNEAMLIAQNR